MIPAYTGMHLGACGLPYLRQQLGGAALQGVVVGVVRLRGITCRAVAGPGGEVFVGAGGQDRDLAVAGVGPDGLTGVSEMPTYKVQRHGYALSRHALPGSRPREGCVLARDVVGGVDEYDHPGAVEVEPEFAGLLQVGALVERHT